MKTPVTLITGYLGSGKTTLVNRLLSDPKGRRIAVLVNEFGAVGIDGDLIRDASQTGEVVELANGCLCCVVSGEFRSALEQLAQRAGEFDHIVIEASGAADPSSVVKAFWGAPELTRRYVLDGVVCVVDAERFLDHVRSDAVVELQAAVADLLWVSKVDRVESLSVAKLREEVAELNSFAEIREGNATGELAEVLLDIRAYRRPRMRTLGFSRVEDQSDRVTVSHGGLRSIAASWEGEVSPRQVQIFFQTLVMEFGNQLVRTKGLFRVSGEKSPWLVQGVQNWIERSKGPSGYKGPNKLVVLGRDLDVTRLSSAISALKGEGTSASDFVPRI